MRHVRLLPCALLLSACATSSLRLDHEWQRFEREAANVQAAADRAVERGVALAQESDDDVLLTRLSMPDSSPMSRVALIQVWGATAYVGGDLAGLEEASEALERERAAIAALERELVERGR